MLLAPLKIENWAPYGRSRILVIRPRRRSRFTAYVENGFLDSGVFLLRNTQVPCRGWSLVLLGPLKIENWAPYGRFLILAIILHVKSRTETPTVQTKELRISFFFFSLLYIGAGPVWVVSGGQPKVRAHGGPTWAHPGPLPRCPSRLTA